MNILPVDAGGLAGENAGSGSDKGPSPGKSSSKTVTDTVIGEHEHTIVGYSLIKGIGDGEPIASERFTVGGHEWVLLFYPDGKRSSSEVHNINPQQVPPPHGAPHPAPPAAAPVAPPAAPAPPPQPAAAPGAMPPPEPHLPQGAAQPGGAPVGAQLQAAAAAMLQQAAAQHVAAAAAAAAALAPQPQQLAQHPGNEYCALFVALIGETDNPQGVVNTSDGRVVRAFHRFTLVDQSGRGQDVTKGRRRDQGAVKISCARQDPNARNCHGYRKFVKKSILEDPGRGLLVNDTLVIRYQIELVVSTGGALSRHSGAPRAPPPIALPAPSLGPDLGALLEDGTGADVTFDVDGERMPAHKILLQARSPVLRALLTGPMREGHEGVVAVRDVQPPVFRALLHYAYTDALPEELAGAGGLEVAMAQHLLAAADRFGLIRLRGICEQRLCETVEAGTVATTLALAEQNNARELKRVCLEFVSKHLQAVMASDGYHYMIDACPQLQAELLAVIAAAPPSLHRSRTHLGAPHPRADESSTDGQLRRVRPRRE